MKHLTYLFIAVSFLSLAACKKSNDTNPLYSYSNVHTFKGNMNDDQVTLCTNGNGSSLILLYKGIPFTATVTSVSFSYRFYQEECHLSLATNGQTKAYADLYLPAMLFANGTFQPASSYIGLYITAPSSIIVTPGSIFESSTYTLSAN